mgnify:CR=1 FL=1
MNGVVVPLDTSSPVPTVTFVTVPAVVVNPESLSNAERGISEISFLLGKYFFPNFVSENVSKEIIYMFSFIVFINAGYFTFMLILDILKAETYI